MYHAQGRFAKAQPEYLTALEITKATLGDAHPDYALILSNLAYLYQCQGQYNRAEPLYLQALKIIKAAVGDAHPDYAALLNNLASLYQWQGQIRPGRAAAEAGARNPEGGTGRPAPTYAVCVNNLGILHAARGRPAKAGPLIADAVRIIEDHLEQTAPVQSEAGQLAFHREPRLPDQPPCPSGHRCRGRVRAVFRWRGAVTARQTFARPAAPTRLHCGPWTNSATCPGGSAT